MRVSGIAIVFAALITAVAGSFGQSPPPQLPADSLQMTSSRALLWSQEKVSIAELHGPVTIDLDHTHLTADDAVIWITTEPRGLVNEQHVEIALIGNAELRQGTVRRMDRNLWVTAAVTGSLRLNGPRSGIDDHGSPLYAQALQLRQGRTAGIVAQAPSSIPERRWNDFPTSRNRVSQTTAPPTTRPKELFEFNNEEFRHMTTSDGHIAVVLTGGVTCRYHGPKGDLLEFVANDAVLFTDLTTLTGVNHGPAQKNLVADHVLAGYFEGDVQLYVTSADATKHALKMLAEQVYYEFRTDRAVLTKVVFHTVDVKKNIPIFIRADVMHQLSQGEFTTENVELTTSAFANPSYSLAASSAYVRAEGTGDPVLGDRVNFTADNALFKAWGVPVFYMPVAAGTMTSRGGPLRNISVSDEGDYGYGGRTEWGLFESLGKVPPKDLDASYRFDYFGKRGPAGGFDGKYDGGFVSETTRDPLNFIGDLHAYFVDDHGVDNLGGSRPFTQPPEAFRGRAYLEHQTFFPDDWQAQFRFGYVSDANFMTQWFADEFRDNLPINESVYLKHQHNSEVFTLLAEVQPNDIVTSSEFVQEQREVDRLPEIGYHRVGDSFGDDRLTFFSDNTASALHFAASGATLAQQGFMPTGAVSPGIPSFAYTGDPGDTTYRGDFRQEVDWPVSAGPFKLVPYAFGRYTVYSEGVHPTLPLPAGRSILPGPIVTSSDQNRVMAGAGIKLTTSFWKVDDSAESDLFDIHRVRHVIEPEIDLFTSAQTIDQNRLFIYDESVDAINDVRAAKISLRQRWQTKRGGPGKWRSVDFFTLDIHADLFANQPDARFINPVDFRGLYFSSLPETSIPRNSVTADALWRISDTTAVLADCTENLDRERFATASIGLAVQREARLNYFIGTRYIADLHSNITTIEVNYQLSRSYDVSVSESFDFGQSQNVLYSLSLTRKFDRFEAGVRVFYDETLNQNGVSFEFAPYGFSRGIGTDQARLLAQQ